MDHAYVRSRSADTPWRTAAVVATGIAAVELFILIILGVVFGAKLTSDHAEKAVLNATTAAKAEAAAPPATSTETKKAKRNTVPTASLSRRRTSVIVLNGNGTPGAAAETAQQLGHFHYTVAATANANRTDFARSLVMYRKGYEGEAIRLAQDVHVKRVTPLDGMELRELQGAHLALILGG